MPYDRNFNNPLVIFTAFPGNMVTQLPMLNWVWVRDAGIGDTEIGVEVHAAGNGTYVLFSKGTFLSDNYKLFTYDLANECWVPVTGFPFHVDYAGNGVYLSIVNDRIYKSTDGREWTTAGVLPDMCDQGVFAVATNGSAATAVCWSDDVPVYTGGISGGYWSPSAQKKDIAFSSPFQNFEDEPVMRSPFNGVEYHNGSCIAYAYGGETYVGLCTGGGSAWSETMGGPYMIDDLRSVHGKLFMRLSLYGGDTPTYQLCVVDNSFGSYTVVRNSANGQAVPYLGSIIWCDRLNRFMALGKRGNSDCVALYSTNGYSWTEELQAGAISHNADKLIYIPGIGFYASNGGVLFFAEYTA